MGKLIDSKTGWDLAWAVLKLCVWAGLLLTAIAADDMGTRVVAAVFVVGMTIADRLAALATRLERLDRSKDRSSGGVPHP